MRNLRVLAHRHGTPGPRGMVLVLATLLIGLFTVMGITMINLAGSDFTVSTNETRSIQALFNADAGLEEAKMRLSPNAPTSPTNMSIPVNVASNWRAYILSGQTQAAIQSGLDATYGKKPDGTTEDTSNYVFYNTIQAGADTITWGWARIQHKMSGANFVYWDPVLGQETPSASQTIGTPAMTVYNPPILVITAEGIQNGVRRVISAEYRPQVTPPVAPSTIVTDPFSNAVHGKGDVPVGSTDPSVELTGNAWTDSYDSRLGPYNVGGNVGTNGNVSTDATRNDAITVSTGSTVNGDINCGQGCVTADAIDLNGTIIGGTLGAESGTWEMPPPTVPPTLTNLGPMDLSGNTKKDGCSLTLSEGSYWYSSISITGQGKLCVTGQVTIYVSGNIDIAGSGVATADNRPPNLLIYGTSACTSVSITGNADFYGAIYAPAALVNISGNGAVYGAVTSNRIRIDGNGGFHYDEALATVGETVKIDPGTNVVTHRYSRYLWREIPF